MVRIIIQNLFHKTIEIDDFSKPTLKHFQDHGIDWMFACGGKGRCTTCRFIVVEGESNFEPLTPPEERYMSLGALKSGERLACQARLQNDEQGVSERSVTVIVPKDTQFPHMKYSDD